MTLRARFGIRPDGKPQFRMVAAGANIDTAIWNDIIYDADWSVVKLAYAGTLTMAGGQSQTVSFPNMGYVPFVLFAVGRTAGIYHNSGYPSPVAVYGPFSQIGQPEVPKAIMPFVYLDEVPQGKFLNGALATVTPSSATFSLAWAGGGYQLNYNIFAVQT